MKIIGLFGLLLCIFSCQNSNSTITKLNYPVCIDSIDVVPSVLAFEDVEGILRYNLLYIGTEKDTILIDYKSGLSLMMSPPPPPPPPPLNYSKTEVLEDTIINEGGDWSEFSKAIDEFEAYWCSIYEPMAHYRQVLWGDSAKVNIVVDTNRYILHYDWLPITGQSFKAYPVIIKNIEKDTVIIATRDYLELVLEGATKDGWETLKEPFRHRGCGNGLTYLLLPPNEILVTSTPVYKWKKSTQLRLKLGNNYSTIFTGNTTVQ